MELTQSLEHQGMKMSDNSIGSCVGYHVILEMGEWNGQICSGELTNYDGNYLKLENFKLHHGGIEDTVTSRGSRYNPESKESVVYSMRERNLEKDIVASIQLYEDVITARGETLK